MPGGRETPAVTTTTTLVHRPYDGPEEWWRHALVYEIPSPALGAAELDRTDPIIKHARYLGMDAVLIRPSLLDIDTEMDSIHRFIDEAGEQGLRTIVRISGALGPITGPYAKQTTSFVTGLEGAADDLLRRSEAYLQAGAAGIDLGTIVPPQLTSGIRLDRLSTYCAMLHGQLAEYVDEGIIGADVTADYPESLRHHLQDDWVHHLRDDCLTLTRWNAESLTSHLTRSLDEHDRFGAPPTWRFLPPHILSEHLDPGDGQRWYSVNHEERLRRGLAPPGMMLGLWAVWSFRRQRTTINPHLPQQTVALVTEGVYRYTRNPMYLGMLCFLLAWALWLSTPLALLGLALYVGYLNRFQIGPEERVLEERFGTRFTSYCATVRRWL